ncbi:MAG: hypothetical protein XXXJIFNMEKO3_02344 [Candidatus Erwinia impunctatus]|nr:hypothetical protein XXXJIFNMEKO_02344 [Culicoides impunctatus]
MLQVTHLSASYQDKPVLQNINLSVKQGSLL